MVEKEEVLPLWVRRVDTLRLGLRSNVWLQARGVPVRGWLLQQLIKLAVAERLTADVLVHVDSDVVLLRPFSVSSIVDQNGRVRLFALPDAVDETLPHHIRWHRAAEKLLGIAPAGFPMPDFISSLVPWKRANALALLEHIQRTTGRHWLRALAAVWDVSEYTLYGRFAQNVLGESAGQFVSSSSLCHDYYKRVPLSVPELEALLDRVGPDEVAVSLTAKAGMKPENYVEVLERRWAALSAQRPASTDIHPGRRLAEHRLDEPVRADEADRSRATQATMSRGSESRGGPLTTGTNRYRIKWAIGFLVALLIVLLLFGVD